MPYLKEFRRLRWPAMKMHFIIDVQKTHKGDESVFKWRVKVRMFFIRHIFRYLRYLMPCYLYIPRVEVSLTTRCTLNCANCISMIPKYRTTENVSADNIDFNVLRTYINNLLQAVDGVAVFKLIGGEPLLHPNIGDVIDLLVSSKKVKLISIITNGTIMPDKAVLDVFKSSNVLVEISDYANLSTKREEMAAVFSQSGIEFMITPFPDGWRDVGDVSTRGRDIDDLKSVFRSCPCVHTNHILNDRLFMCPRVAHVTNLGLYPADKSEFVELGAPKEEIRSRIADLYLLDYIPSCNRCDRPCGAFIEPAIQIKHEN